MNAMLKPHPSFLSHTCTDKMPKRQTRKKKQKKNPFGHFLPSHSLREKKQIAFIYMIDLATRGNWRIWEKTSSRNRRGFAALWEC